MQKRKFSDADVRNFYKYAASRKMSLLQASRDQGLSGNDYAIMRNWGKKLGLTPLAASELSGHAHRECQLYALIVDGKGIYIGSSADPELRFKQHIQKAKRDGKNGVNKRDRFIYQALIKDEQCCKIKIFCKKYRATEIAHREPRLIAKVQAAFPDAVHLNGLVGAPMGGYGVKLSDDEIQAVIDDYTQNKITTEQLAHKYNVRRSTINRILQRAGATKTRAEMMIRYDDTVRQKIVKDIKAGAKDAEITKKYGMASRTLYLLKKEHGLIKFKRITVTNVKVCGETFQTLQDACKRYGIMYVTAKRRIKNGWSAEEALEIEPRIKPYTKKLTPVTAFGVEYKSMTHASQAFGVNPQLVAQRVRDREWAIEDALTIKTGGAHRNQWASSPETRKRLREVRSLGYSSLVEAAKDYGIGAGTVSRRLAAGMSVKDALETPIMNGGAVRWGKPLNEIFLKGDNNE